MTAILEEAFKMASAFSEKEQEIIALYWIEEMKSRIVVPTIAEMLDELDNIKMKELAELEIPIRKDRKNQLLSWISDDISM